MTTFAQRISVLSITALCLVLQVPEVHARGGGGCVEQGTTILTPAGPVAIEQLKTGGIVLGASGFSVVPVTIRSIMQVQPDEYYELTANNATLRLTAEHPVEIASGVFRMASHLRQGDAVILHESGRTVSGVLSSIVHVKGSKPARPAF